jgi:hypothetical protein
MIPTLLNYIMHHYHVGKEYVEFSNNSAAKALDVDPRQIARARKSDYRSRLVEARSRI